LPNTMQDRVSGDRAAGPAHQRTSPLESSPATFRLVFFPEARARLSRARHRQAVWFTGISGAGGARSAGKRGRHSDVAPFMSDLGKARRPESGIPKARAPLSVQSQGTTIGNLPLTWFGPGGRMGIAFAVWGGRMRRERGALRSSLGGKLSSPAAAVPRSSQKGAPYENMRLPGLMLLLPGNRQERKRYNNETLTRSCTWRRRILWGARRPPNFLPMDTW